MATSTSASDRLGSKERRVILLVFTALLLDLLAFTIPLPLFPRIIEWYSQRSTSADLLAQTLSGLRAFRGILVSSSVSPLARSSATDKLAAGAVAKKWDVVLLGGFLGSVFSFCQFLISPLIGRLADRFGRKRVLLATMVGNLLSTVLWLQSTSFTSFLLARLVGGLSEGNVQLSILILSDVTTPATRPRALALVGLAFSLCFTFGPLLGAWFASRPLPGATLLSGRELNLYATPAAIALGLLALETTYLAFGMPETKAWRIEAVQDRPAKTPEAGKTAEPPIRSLEERKRALAELKSLHRAFLFFFSGAEFTLTFLTYDLFQFSNAQSGKLLSFIGVLSSLLQGGYTRRPAVAAAPLALSHRGVLATSVGLLMLAYLPFTDRSAGGGIALWVGAACLAFASASVVNGLNAGASVLCSDEADAEQTGELVKGRTMGAFRSAGQLGRALGPIFACTSYWLLGPTVCYAINGLSLGILGLRMGAMVRRERELREATAAAEQARKSA